MGVRETLNKQPALTTGATVGIILLALVFIIYQVSGTGRPRIPTKAYYSVDDGATYFSDDINLVAPYDYEGKKAVKAYVFKCASGKAFVGYLERFSADAKKAIEDSRAKPNAPMIEETVMSGMEVKAPLTGDKAWVKSMIPAASKVILPRCPDGSQDLPEQVMP